LQTAILNIRGNVAKGFTINNDLTINHCFVVKQDNVFSHGKTLKEAYAAIREKIFNKLDVDAKIEMFLLKFDRNTKYNAKEFFEWHGKLTASCLFGREQFVKEKSINLEKDCFTMQEFIDMTQNSFGGEIINKIKEVIENGEDG